MPVLVPSLLALSLALGAVPALDSDSDDTPLGPSLTLPDGPTIPMPPGSEVFGPQGRKRDGPPEQRPSVEQSQKNAAPAPHLSPEQRRKARIDDLFAQLASAKDEAEAEAVGEKLTHLWLQSGSDTADLLMSRALSAVAGQDYKTAVSLLDKIVVLQPGWAEAWNRRATVHYLQDDDVASMVDLSHTLALEPRHFGALSGMGFILHREGDDKGALAVLRKAATINPQDSSVQALIKELTPEVEGRDI